MYQFRCLELAKETYQNCVKLELPHYLKDQLVRASSSVALNLAEGRGRHTHKDQYRFFAMAYGSIREVQTILSLAGLESEKSFTLANSTGASIYKLMKNMKT